MCTIILYQYDNLMMQPMPTRVRAVLLCCLGALPAYAAQDAEALINLGLTNTWVRFSAIAIFVLAYTFVVMEERTHLR